MLLFASYFFYGWWDWRFLGLIAFSSILDYSIALGIEKYRHRARLLIWITVGLNLGLLFTFKYYDFFISSFYAAFTDSAPGSYYLLEILLPAGISFYTFQTMSYTIDVYRGDTPAERSLLNFMVFVSYFPQLVAGPIERASELIPQLVKRSSFRWDDFSSGINLILIGLAKKVLIADQLAVFVDQAFDPAAVQPGNYYLFAAIFFSFQIYCDFSGYSDIARGSSRLLGVELMINFNFPYFSKSPAEFWNRWHISLYSWFKSYVYIPLGGNRKGARRRTFNLLLVFFLSGIWHGANWTFVVWGVYNGLLVLFLGRMDGRIGSHMPDVLKWFWTYLLILAGWIFFRVDTLSQGVDFFNRIFFNEWSMSVWHKHQKYFYLILVLLAFEYLVNRYGHKMPVWQRKGWLLGLSRSAIIVLIYLYTRDGQGFIYFQF